MTSLNLPLGYRYAAAYAGIRKDSRPDLGLIVSSPAANAAGVFTANRVQAAPVRLSLKHLAVSHGKASAILVNAGNANCATRTGDAAALASCRAAAKQLGVPVSHVLPNSTGVIGVELDAFKIVDALPALVSSLAETRFQDVANAILTTDLVPKTAFAELTLDRGEVRFAGMTKGSGMIQPLMATTLGFVMTDAEIGVNALRRILRKAVERSYNRISVDGDTSTNDTLLLLANGASGVRPLARELPLLEEAAATVMEELAKMIARDGEGASKLVTIDVSGARDNASAARVARSIANSPLVKTAICGADPNWGRILSAAGNAGVEFDPSKVDIDMQGLAVCRGGLAAHFSEAELKSQLESPECVISLRFRGKGTGEARFWTCDLTEGYIRINASYRT
jgi:glutamate N-acetyltransferase/amino-acid N-acetyltransferase